MAKVNVYQMITDKMISELSNGIVPWHKPWVGISNFAVSHTNGKPYSLLNQFLLDNKGGEWLTFNQIKNLGGTIKKGEKSHFVVFWTQFEKAEIDEDGKRIVTTIPVLKYYNVWEIGQTEGIAAKYTKEIVDSKAEPIEVAENVVGLYFDRESVVLHKVKNSDRAFYCPSTDEVNVPCISQFEHAEEYYSTLFHEMTHSTGHQSRLNRKEVVESNFFGSEDYSKEELVAEMGAAFLCNQLGIDTEKAFKNSVAYVQSWLSALKNDNKMLVSAASRAEKAVRYILGEIENVNA